MTCSLRWQGRDDHSHSIPLYPWDREDTVLDRIALTQGTPLRSLTVRGLDLVECKLVEVIDWPHLLHPLLEEKLNSSDIPRLGLLLPELRRVLGSSPIQVEDKLLLRDLMIEWLQDHDKIVDETSWRSFFPTDPETWQQWKEGAAKARAEDHARHRESQQRERAYRVLSDVYRTRGGGVEESKNEEEDKIIRTSWRVKSHRLIYRLQESRLLGDLFNSASLPEPWLLLLFHETRLWSQPPKTFSMIRRYHDPRVLALVENLTKDEDDKELLQASQQGLSLYRENLEKPVLIRHTKDHLEMELESRHGLDLLSEVRELLSLRGEVTSTEDIGLVGTMTYRDLYIPYPLFQDVCMNNRTVHHFLYINELRRAHYQTSLPVWFRPDLRQILGLPEKRDRTSFYTPDLTLVNTHRHSGYMLQINLTTPLREDKLEVFMNIMERLLHYFLQQQKDLVHYYEQFLPDFQADLEKTKSDLSKVKQESHSYLTLYPMMFVKGLYSVRCQKPMQPILVSEKEAASLPENSVLFFPPEPKGEIMPEYYHCPNPKYPVAGLFPMDINGLDVYINRAPCCFKSKRDVPDAARLASVRTRDDEDWQEAEEGGGGGMIRSIGTGKETKDDITGDMLIKFMGQKGRINPPLIIRFFMAIDPLAEYRRLGNQQGPSSLISCLLQRYNLSENFTDSTVEEVREKMARDDRCVQACLQENPGRNFEEVRKDMADPRLYFDPRRFYRACELYFQVLLVVFTKPPKIQSTHAELLFPFSMRSHYTQQHPHRDHIVFVMEHWGGKTNILTKLSHPHNELLIYKPFTETNWRVDFTSSRVMGVLETTRLDFDASRLLQPLDTKVWFLRKVVGQTVDPLGKVRVLHFKIGNDDSHPTILPGILDQPLPILDKEEGVTATEIPAISFSDSTKAVSLSPSILTFLQRFHQWTRVRLHPDQKTLLWTVTQPRVFWRLSDTVAHSLSLTFLLRLSQPLSSEVLRQRLAEHTVLQKDHPHLLRELEAIPTLPPSLLLPTIQMAPELTLQQLRSTARYQEKLARCLYDLSVSCFAHYLREHKIPMGAMDPDEILDSFKKRHILIDPQLAPPLDRLIDPSTAVETLYREKKIHMPHLDFWKRVAYNLRWQMFYDGKGLEARGHSFHMLPYFYQKLSDFSVRPLYYLCELPSLLSVLQDAVEGTYPLLTQSFQEMNLESFPRLVARVAYHRQESPFPSQPYLVVLYPSLIACRYALHQYHQSSTLPDPRHLPHEEVLEGTVEMVHEPYRLWNSETKEWTLVLSTSSTSSTTVGHIANIPLTYQKRGHVLLLPFQSD